MERIELNGGLGRDYIPWGEYLPWGSLHLRIKLRHQSWGREKGKGKGVGAGPVKLFEAELSP